MENKELLRNSKVGRNKYFVCVISVVLISIAIIARAAVIFVLILSKLSLEVERKVDKKWLTSMLQDIAKKKNLMM